jgi:hypothetical protein
VVLVVDVEVVDEVLVEVVVVDDVEVDDVEVEVEELVVVVEGRVVLVEDVVGMGDVVELVDVDVVVVVAQDTPQHGRFGTCVTVSGGTMTDPVRMGAAVRQSSSFTVVAVRRPATVRPVLAERRTAPAGLPPKPSHLSCPAAVTLIWHASMSIVPPTPSGLFTGSTGATLCR